MRPATLLFRVAVAGRSMEPTFHDGDWLLVRKLGRPPRAGEVSVLAIPPGTETQQVEALGRRKAARELKAVENSLLALEAAASTDVNLMPLLIDCARAECTLGEMVNALKRVFGVYRESPAF